MANWVAQNIAPSSRILTLKASKNTTAYIGSKGRFWRVDAHKKKPTLPYQCSIDQRF